MRSFYKENYCSRDHLFHARVQPTLIFDIVEIWMKSRPDRRGLSFIAIEARWYQIRWVYCQCSISSLRQIMIECPYIPMATKRASSVLGRLSQGVIDCPSRGALWDHLLIIQP